ncbi:Hypothetical predicted protein [Pelobates cultripes]|uniref:Endonuclease/exonuclease/phosphatase domain-containing protein n=1 Tax=Pelobates cultripes TaxID=61616 RepID=A0AAD1QXY8_PELCU|nr:Hypothetical predicted protein [Pelobates cultripes]
MSYSASNPESKTKGVTILFSADTPFHMEGELPDPSGRYLFLKGTIHNTQFTFANLYLPNKGQKPFLKKTLALLDSFNEGKLILGGDFNTLEPRLDTSTGHSTLPGHVLQSMKATLHEVRLLACPTPLGERLYVLLPSS